MDYIVCVLYPTSNSRECMGVNGESLQLHAVYKKPYFLLQARENPYQYYKSRKIPYQVLQVTRAASERAMVCMIKSLSPYYQAVPEKSLICCR